MATGVTGVGPTASVAGVAGGVVVAASGEVVASVAEWWISYLNPPTMRMGRGKRPERVKEWVQRAISRQISLYVLRGRCGASRGLWKFEPPASASVTVNLFLVSFAELASRCEPSSRAEGEVADQRPAQDQ